MYRLGCLILFTTIIYTSLSLFGISYAAGKECVILLHGLGRTYRSMNKLADVFENEGYVVANIDYPSTDSSIQELSAQAIPAGVHQCRKQQSETIHFVTHSMGGILLRNYLKSNQLEELGRSVMLGPPNRGSEIADTLMDTWFYRKVFGPAGQQLGTDATSFVNNLGPVTWPVGIIAGSEASIFDGWFADIIPGEDDGKVGVDRAKVEGMSDFLVLPYNHSFMMRKQEVIDQSRYFVQHGVFLR